MVDFLQSPGIFVQRFVSFSVNIHRNLIGICWDPAADDVSIFGKLLRIPLDCLVGGLVAIWLIFPGIGNF